MQEQINKSKELDFIEELELKLKLNYGEELAQKILNDIYKISILEEIKNDKIILAIPLYTRLWTEDSSGKVVKQTTVSMKNVDKIIPSDVKKQWNDNLKQYYVEYKDGSYTKKMWIEDEESLKAKISLINNNNLGGVASWEKGMEIDDFWTFLKENLDF